MDSENLRGKNLTVLIDSNLWIEYLNGTPLGKKASEFIEGNERVVISAINLAEVFRHVLSKKKRADAEKAKEILLQYSFSIAVTTNIAIEAATLKVEKSMGLADAIIYATAKQENAQIITADNDFRGQENVLILS